MCKETLSLTEAEKQRLQETYFCPNTCKSPGWNADVKGWVAPVRHCVPDSSSSISAKVNQEKASQCLFQKVDFFSLIFQVKLILLIMKTLKYVQNKITWLWDTVSMIINKIISDISILLFQWLEITFFLRFFGYNGLLVFEVCRIALNSWNSLSFLTSHKLKYRF